MRKNDYVIYDEPYKLNIVGVRNAQTQPNKFDDSIFVFFKDSFVGLSSKIYDKSFILFDSTNLPVKKLWEEKKYMEILDS